MFRRSLAAALVVVLTLVQSAGGAGSVRVGSSRACAMRRPGRAAVVAAAPAPAWLERARTAAAHSLAFAALAVLPMVATAENELAEQCGGKFDSSLIDKQCFQSSCGAQTQACIENAECMKGLVCTARCLGDTGCISGCFARFGNADVDGLIKCSIEDHSCIKAAILPAGPDAPDEVPEPPKPVVHAFSPKSLEGKWYKVMGWNSMYDCYDCQQNKFTPAEKAARVHGVSDGPGADGKMVVDVDFDMPRPAKLLRASHNHKHLQETLVFDEPGSKRTAHTQGSMFGLSFWENWYLIGENARDEPDFKFVYYNGRTVQNKYEGAFVYARTPDVPKEALPSIYRLAEEAGLDPSTFCKVRNSCGVPGKLGPELIGVEGVLAEELPEQRAASVPSNPLVLSSLQLWYELTDFLEDPHYAGSYILQQQERMPPVQAIQGLGQGLGESASGAASSGSP